ncbi:MAG: DNA polymerase III subunit chi [Myxococcota bacterium]
MTPRVTFYDTAPDARFPRIARLVDAAWQRGRSLLIHCADPRTAADLDTFLWTFEEASFVPHEIVAPGGTPKDPDGRIVLVTAEENPVGAEVLVQEAPTSLDFAAGFPFVIDLVDHRTPEALASSRARFKSWRERGLKPAFKR